MIDDNATQELFLMSKISFMLFLCHNFIVKKCFISHLMVTKSNQSHINICTIVQSFPEQWSDAMWNMTWGARRDRQHWHRESSVWSAHNGHYYYQRYKGIRDYESPQQTQTPLRYIRHINLKFLIPAPHYRAPVVSGCRHWLSVKVRSSRRSHLPFLTTIRGDKRGEYYDSG